MSRYIGQIDYTTPGDDDKYPRWAVWEQYFIWAGNHGTRRISKFYWTEAEAQAELNRLNIPDQRFVVVLAFIMATAVAYGLFRWAW